VVRERQHVAPDARPEGDETRLAAAVDVPRQEQATPSGIHPQHQGAPVLAGLGRAGFGSERHHPQVAEAARRRRGVHLP